MGSKDKEVEFLGKDDMKQIKCCSCQKEWYVEKAELKNVLLCPFCGVQIRQKTDIVGMDTLGKVLYRAVKDKGTEILTNSSKICGYLLDMAPDLRKEIRIFSRTFDNDSLLLYKATFEQEMQIVETTINKLKWFFIEENGLSDAWADMLYENCLSAVRYYRGEGISDVFVAEVKDVIIQKQNKEDELIKNESIIPEVITNNNRNDKEIHIISEQISVIKEAEYYANKVVKKIILPDTLRIIEKDAFKRCVNLKEIELQEGIEEIGDNAFEDCESLECIIIPHTVQTLGENIFSGCKKLNKVVVSHNIKEIKEDTFKQCDALKDIVLGQDTVVHKNAFDSLIQPKITYIDFLSKKLLDFGWFLESNGTLVIENISHARRQREYSMFVWEKEAIKLIFCNGIDELKIEEFKGLRRLNEIVFPATLKEISYGCFRNCSALEKIYIPSGVTSIAAHAFENCKNLKFASIPSSVKYIGQDAFKGCQLQEIFVGRDCAISPGNKGIKNMSF